MPVVNIVMPFSGILGDIVGGAIWVARPCSTPRVEAAEEGLPRRSEKYKAPKQKRIHSMILPVSGLDFRLKL